MLIHQELKYHFLSSPADKQSQLKNARILSCQDWGTTQLREGTKAELHQPLNYVTKYIFTELPRALYPRGRIILL